MLKGPGRGKGEDSPVEAEEAGEVFVWFLSLQIGQGGKGSHPPSPFSFSLLVLTLMIRCLFSTCRNPFCAYLYLLHENIVPKALWSRGP